MFSSGCHGNWFFVETTPLLDYAPQIIVASSNHCTNLKSKIHLFKDNLYLAIPTSCSIPKSQILDIFFSKVHTYVPYSLFIDVLRNCFIISFNSSNKFHYKSIIPMSSLYSSLISKFQNNGFCSTITGDPAATFHSCFTWTSHVYCTSKFQDADFSDFHVQHVILESTNCSICTRELLLSSIYVLQVILLVRYENLSTQMFNLCIRLYFGWYLVEERYSVNVITNSKCF